MQIDTRLSTYLREFAEGEDEPLRAARARSEETDIPAVPPETGALLGWLARLGPCRHAVEIGTGGGYSSLWLVRGMDPKGTLVTIEVDPDNQALAQQAFAEAEATDRVRAILGPALSVLPRLADGAYDLAFLDAVKSEYPEYLAHAKRLLRPGGLLIADNVLWQGQVADPSVTDPDTEGLRAFNAAVRDDPSLHAQIIPIGDGVLAAVHRPQETRA